MTRFLPPLLAALAFATPVTPAPVDSIRPAERIGPGVAFLATKADDGLFRLTAERDGRAVALVVDTGATQTILTRRDARALGVPAGGEVVELLTANGTATMRLAHVSGLKVADRTLPPLQVAVAETGLAQSLLGQDAIARLGPITIDGDRLQIGRRRP